jgi:hypothetical protein
MAQDWFVQHGGKQYGPMSPSNLKKLAADGKITPATQVRMGETGAWVSASKVQGLFATQTNSSSATQTPPPPASPPIASAPPPPPFDPLAELPRAVAKPIKVSATAPPPWSRSSATNTAPTNTGVAAKVLGAFAMILAAVAVATCWLPLLDGPIGWTGIAFGALGLLVGMAGIVAATTSNSSAGLVLNIFGSGGSAFGLALAIVFGVMFGLFGGQPEPVVTARPELPPVVEAPPKVETPEPKPAPPPEPVWTDAKQPLEQFPIRAKVESVGIEQIRMESTDLSKMSRPKPQPMLKMVITLENVSADRIVEAPGWMGGGDLIGQGVGQLLGGQAGKAVQSATPIAALTDNVGNKYSQAHTLSLFGAQLNLGPDQGLRPSDVKKFELVFPPPLETIEYLRLELSPGGFGGSEPLRFQIPKEMIFSTPPPGVS